MTSDAPPPTGAGAGIGEPDPTRPTLELPGTARPRFDTQGAARRLDPRPAARRIDTLGGLAAGPPPSTDSSRFGTEAFYAAIGRAFVAMCAVVPLLFLIELVDRLVGHRLDSAGAIQPRTLTGLDGVFFAPLLHASFNHLLANSVPLILLGTFVLAAGTRRFVATTVLIMLVSGLGVWFTGDPRSLVVGASGVIFGYLGVLFARGVVERSWWNIAVGVLIGLLYGWQLIGVLPTDERVSWQSHLFGFFGGVVAAVLFRRRPPAHTVGGA